MPREFKTILCGTDFSENSYHALAYGLRFARASGGTLIVAHSIHVPTGELMGEGPFNLNFQEMEARVRQLLEQLHEEKLDLYAGCELRVEIGEPAEQLLAVARDREVDLIVTSTRGRSGLAHLVMGSVAEKVIRYAPCPVLVVRAGVD